MRNATLCALAVLAAAVVSGNGLAHAASRFGGMTDDSVCDVGSTEQRQQGVPRAGDFIKQSCKNGQILLGTSVVPIGPQSMSEVIRLAMAYCGIADIQSQRVQRNVAGIAMDYETVRCKLERLE